MLTIKKIDGRLESVIVCDNCGIEFIADVPRNDMNFRKLSCEQVELHGWKTVILEEGKRINICQNCPSVKVG